MFYLIIWILNLAISTFVSSNFDSLIIPTFCLNLNFLPRNCDLPFFVAKLAKFSPSCCFLLLLLAEMGSRAHTSRILPLFSLLRCTRAETRMFLKGSGACCSPQQRRVTTLNLWSKKWLASELFISTAEPRGDDDGSHLLPGCDRTAPILPVPPGNAVINKPIATTRSNLALPSTTILSEFGHIRGRLQASENRGFSWT